MFSTSKLIAVAATIVLAAGLYSAGMLTSQPESQPAAAPSAEAPGWATPVTGVRLGVYRVNDTQLEWVEGDGWNEIRNYKIDETYEWSDPRLPASVTTSLNAVEPTDDSWRGQVIRAATLLEDPDGYWTGSSVQFADEAEAGFGLELLTGHGAYEGLSAILKWTTDDPDCIECLTASGYIYEREMVEAPEPLEPASGS